MNFRNQSLAVFFSVLCIVNFPVAQAPDSLRASKRTIIKGLIAPSSLLVAGLALNSNHSGSVKFEIDKWRDKQIPGFKTKIDNYLLISPLIAAYGLDLAGVKSRTDIANRSVILLKGEILAIGSMSILKSSIRQLRPDSSKYNSFPSGHTAQAFAAATLLSEEYKQKFPWMPYAAYGVAGSVGIFRMANNKHYISDVLFGAGLGILSMKVAYWTHRYRWNRTHRPTVRN